MDYSSLLSQLVQVPGMTNAFIETCPIGSLSCQSGVMNTLYYIIEIMRIAFYGILLGMLTLYAMKMLVASMSDSAVEESRMAYLHAFIGTVLVLAATEIAAAFVTPEVVDPGGLGLIIDRLSGSLAQIVGAALLFDLVYQATILLSNPNESTREAATKHLVYGISGAIIVVLARAIVAIFWEADVGIALDEIGGLVRFFSTIFGVMAFAGLVISGILYVIAYTDAIKDRAKNLFFASIFSLIIVLVSYAIIGFFI